MDAKLRTAIGRATSLEGGYDDLSPYQVTEVFSLAQIPRSVRKRLFGHLINRLGKGFFLKLRLESGQIVDIAKMHRVNTSRSGTSPKTSRCTGHKSACPLRRDRYLQRPNDQTCRRVRHPLTSSARAS